MKLLFSLALLCTVMASKAQNISTENGMIKFNSISDYVYYADNTANRSSLSSYSSSSDVNTLAKQAVKPDDDVVPGFLQLILNSSNMLTIGNYLVKFDFPNNRALVLNKNSDNAVNTLINNNISQSGVMVLDFDEEYEGIEVFQGLENGSVNESNYTNLISPSVLAEKCRRANKHKDEDQEVWSTLKMDEHFLNCSEDMAHYKYDYKIVYQRFLLYYRIFGKSKNRTSCNTWFTNELAKDVRLHGNIKYDVRCKGESTNSFDLTDYVTVQTWVPYDGSHSLSRYDFNLSFQSKHTWESAFNHDVALRIVDGY
jgi:hypothetical protein